eukprot:jgi/Chrzof1/14197/Cz08g29050.t1
MVNPYAGGHTLFCTLMQFDYLGETTEGNLHLVQRLKRAGMVSVFGLQQLEDIYTVAPEKLQAAAQEVLDELDVPPTYSLGNPSRAVYCSRTLNLRSIKAIGEQHYGGLVRW